MGIFGRKQGRRRGFTIVEVVVVISVIGILASIVAVAYPQYQMRARDSERKSDMSQLAAALKAYALQKNDFMVGGSGCGFLGDGNGWYNAGPNASFPKSIDTCLQEAGVIKERFIDPSGCIFDSGGTCGSYGGPVKAYMKATCQKSGQPVTYVLAYLEGESRKDSEIDALCDVGTMTGFDANSQKWGTNYGMNYYVTVD